MTKWLEENMTYMIWWKTIEIILESGKATADQNIVQKTVRKKKSKELKQN